MPAPADPPADPPSASRLPALPITWRPTRTRVALHSSAAVLAVGFAAMAVAMPRGWQWYDRLAIAVVGVLFAVGLLVLARPRATADRDGVTVVNLVSSRRLCWAEILRVNLRRGDPWAVLDLADGSTLAVMGIQPAAGRERAVRAARELRDLADSLGTALD